MNGRPAARTIEQPSEVMKQDEMHQQTRRSAVPSPARRDTPASWRLALVLVLAVTFSTSAFSADPGAWVTVHPAEVRPGGLITLSILFENGVLDEMPKLKLPPEFEVTTSEPAFGEQTVRSRGFMRRVPTLTWQLTCSKVGEYIIPSQEVTVSGVVVKTSEARVVVKDNPAYDLDPILSLEVGKREFYVGEVVPLTVSLYYRRSVSVPRVGLIEIPKDNFAIQRFPQKGDLNSIQMGGVPYHAEVFNSTMSAMKPGTFKLGPAASEIIVEMPTGDPRMLHPLFQDQKETRKMRPQTTEVEVNVLPLPTEGVPKGFNNLVGDFTIDMRAEPTELSVNDPIVVEITITGTGNFDAVAMPGITDTSAWKTYTPRRFNVQSSDNPMDGSPRSIGFSQVIVPKQKVDAVPSFEFSYFSPTKKKYEIMRTPPKPITVRAPAEPLEGPPPKAIPVATPGGQIIAETGESKVPQVKPQITDILAMLPERSHWLAARPSLWADKRFVTANVIAGGALLLLILGKIGLVAWRSHQNSPLAPSRQLLRKMQASRISRSRFYELAASFIAARGLSGERVQAVLDRHHLVNYGKDANEAEQQVPRDERNKVLASLQSA
jgi:hypothetical protein